MQQKHRQVSVNVTHQLKNRCTIHGDRVRGNCAGRRVAVAGCHACAAALARELNRASAGSIVHGCACDTQHGCANTSTTSMWCSAHFTRYRHGQGHHATLVLQWGICPCSLRTGSLRFCRTNKRPRPRAPDPPPAATREAMARAASGTGDGNEALQTV